MSFPNSNGSLSQDKLFRLKQVVKAMEEYFQSKKEDTALMINMHMQSLSVTIDLSVFDPHTPIACQFYTNLYELMNKAQERSSLAWNCVDVLTNACRNPSARLALIETYQFIPSLSRLLSDQLSEDKKRRLLRLMQDLTCGIKISWHIPHLPFLMTTLTRWVQNDAELDIATLSLGVLVNLCSNNLPAIYTLTVNTDVKKLLQFCSNMQGSIVELLTCKLLMILDYTNGEIPKPVLSKGVSAAFESIVEAFQKRDSIVLRQIVQFFFEVNKHSSVASLASRHFYEEQLKIMLKVIENSNSMETGDGDSCDPECIALVFDFLNFLIQLKLPPIYTTFPVIIQMALKWIQTDLVSTQALTILTSVAISVDQSNSCILEPLVQGLPIFLTSLSAKDEGIDHAKRATGMLQLLRAMGQVPTIRPKILTDLKVDTMKRLFVSLLGDENGMNEMQLDDPDLGRIEIVHLYAHALALIHELAKYSDNWMNMLGDLMHHKQVHLVLGRSIYEGSEDCKNVVLELSGDPLFPRRMVAEVITTLQHTVSPTSDLRQVSKHNIQDLNFPVFSLPQNQKIDSVLAKFESVFGDRQDLPILTSSVIELYEYKLAAMGNAERAAMASGEAASERCTHLQHRIAHLSAELSKLHQLLYHVQQRNEQETKLKNDLSEIVKRTTNQNEAYKGKVKVLESQIASCEKELDSVKDEFAVMSKTLEKSERERLAVEEKNASFRDLVPKLEQNALRLQNNVQKKEEALKRSEEALVNANAKIKEVESLLKLRESSYDELRREKKIIEKELEKKNQILNTITKLSVNSQNGSVFE